MAKDITVYTQPGCMPCTMLKQWLNSKDLSYTVKDLSLDDDYRKEIEDLGAMGTPVTIVDDEVIMKFGADARGRLEELLSE